MNSKTLFAVAAFAAIAASGVRADEADGSQYAIKFEGSRSRAEVQAEASKYAASRSTEPAGSRIAAPTKSTVDTTDRRAQTVEAMRLGRISRGELGSM